jgi:hypothetical protein
VLVLRRSRLALISLLLAGGILLVGANRAEAYSQLGSAKIIYKVGKSKNVSSKLMLAAFEAALVESTLNNTATNGCYTGLFQMCAGARSSVSRAIRTRGAWGSRTQLKDPAYVSQIFFGIAKKAPSGYSAAKVAWYVERGPPASSYAAKATSAKRWIAKARNALGTSSGGSSGGVSA